ncbi:MAG: M18 family aminopeptidase [Ruminococcaceae bacterium]|nr:M18 family aminopeptidase [Oscillospiraceae bacterium]
MYRRILMNQQIRAFCDFLDQAKSFYHVAENAADMLLAQGFVRLDESQPWTLEAGGKYFIDRNSSSLVAFCVPEGVPTGYLMSACHSDRPAFMVKENGELTGRYTRLATERYGGMLVYPWLDRPLSIAGRVLVETDSGIESRLIDLDRDIAMIPSVAIHMNRTVNEGFKWDPAVDTMALLGSKDVAGKLPALLEQAAGGKILSQDLYLYVREKARVWGLEEEYVSAPGLDDLHCVWGCLQGFLRGQGSSAVTVLAIFDSEEVGCNSPQGADGTLLSGTLARISRSLGLDHDCMLSGSFMVSADNAHAIHPNHPELCDPGHPVEMNAGIVVKFSATQNYTSDGLSAAVFRKICDKAGVPTQTFYNRADLKGGATLGHFSLNHVSVPSVDIGLAQLAMHSSYETAGVNDTLYLEQAMTAYYGTTLRPNGKGYVME